MGMKMCIIQLEILTFSLLIMIKIPGSNFVSPAAKLSGGDLENGPLCVSRRRSSDAQRSGLEREDRKSVV